MEEEKYRLSEQAGGKAKIVLAGAIDNRYIVSIMLLLALGIAMHFVGTELLQPVFAERYLTPIPEASSTQQAPAGNSYYRSMSESMAVVASYGSGSGNSPMSYQRSMSEFMSVTTVQGKPTNSYSRSMSEQVSLSTGMPSAPMQPVRINAESSSGSSYSLSNLRSDERSRILGKGSNALGRIAGSGTSMYSSGSNQGMTEDETASFDIISGIFRRTSSGDDGSDGESSQESDSSSNNFVLDYTGLDGKFLEQRLAAGNVGSDTSNFIGYYYVNVINGFYSIGVIAIVAKRSRIILRSRHKLAKTAELVGFTVESKASRACLVVLVLFIVIAVAGSFGALPIDAAFADNKLASAYRSDTGTFLSNSVKYREWDPVTETWSAEVELADTGSPISSTKILFSPISSMRVIITYSDNGALNLFTCSSACTTAGSWTRVGGASFATAALPASNPAKPYDIAFEQSSGKLVIVYDKDLTENNDFYYRTFNGVTISGESGFNYIGASADAEFIRAFNMASKPGSNEITMILEDVNNQDAWAFVWNSGTASFGNSKQVSSAMGSTSAATFAIDVAYETSNGASVVFSGNGANSAAYARWNGASWSAVSTTDPNALANNDVRFVTLKADPVSTSNKIMICQVDDLSDLTCAQIDGGVLGAWTKHDDNGVDNNVDNTSRRVFDFAWNPTGSAGVLVWGTTSGSIHYRQWSGTVWSTAFYAVPYANTKAWVVGTTNPMSRKSAFLVLNGASDIGSLIYDGLELKVIGTQTHTADTASVLNEALSIDYQRRPAVRAILESMFVSDSVGNRADNPAAMVYRSNTGTNGLHSVKYREWNPTSSTWSSEVELPTTGNDVRDAKILFSPTSTLRAVVSHSADGSLNLFTCSSACTTAGSWTRVGGASFADTGSPIGDVPYRPYDIAFEQSSGKLVIVYDKDLTENNDFYYRTFSSGTLSSETGFTYIGGAADSEEIRYFKLASKAGSNELTMILEDATNTDTYAFIWNSVSGTFGNQKTVSTALSTANTEGESIGAAYETSNGASVVFSGNGANSAAYARWNGASWSAVSTTDPNTNSGNDVRFVTLKADPVSTSNKIMICQVDDLSDLTCAQIDGGVLGAWTSLNANLDSSTSRPADYVWDSSGSTGLAVYGTTADVITKRTWDGANWSGATSVDSVGTHLWIVLVRNPMGSDKNKALMGMINSNADIGTMVYDGTNVKNLGDSIQTAFLTNMDFEAMSIDFQRYGRVISRSINVNLAVTDVISVAFTRQVSVQLGLSDTISRTIGSVDDGVQRGSLSLTSISQDITINQVDPTKALILFSVRSSDSGPDNLHVTAKFVNSTTVRFEKYGTAITDIEWEVIENQNFNVQAGETAYTTTDSSLNVDITGVDLTESFIVVSNRLNSGANANNVEGFWTARFADADTISLERATTGSAGVVSWQVVSIADSNVQSGSASMVGSSGDTDSITSVDLTNSLLIFSARAANATGIGETSVRGALTDSQTITFSRNDNGGSVFVEWFVIEWGQFAVQRGQTTVSGSATVNQPIATVASMNGTFHMHSRDSTGTGTAFANAALTSAITSTTNLQFQKGTSSQTQVVEWQVVVIFRPYTRSMSDQMTLTDNLVRSIALSRSISEVLALNDGITKNVPKSMTDQLGLTDSIQRTVVAARAVSEDLGITETIAKILSKAITEQLTLTEAIARSSVASRSIAEQLTMTETVSKAITTMLTTQLSIEDAIARAIVTTRSLSEQLAMTESVAKVVSKSMSENLAVTETTTRAIVTSRALSEQISLTETIAKNVAMSLSEELATTDQLARAVAASRAATEQLTTADSVHKLVSKAISEQLSITENIARSTATSRSISEELALTASVAKAITYPLSEDLSVTDTIDRSSTLARSISEQLALIETALTNTSKPLTVQLAMTDSLERSITTTRTLSEQLAVTDAVSKAFSTAMSEQLGITESPARVAALSRSMSEQFTLVDSISKVVSVSITEQLAFADTLTRTMALTRALMEQLAVNETIAISISKSISEQLGMTDELQRSISVTAAPSEQQLALTDSIAISLSKSLSEQLEVEDTIARSIALSRSISEELTVNDQISKVISKAMSEDLAVTDEIQRTIVSTRNMSEQLGVTDTVTKAVSVVLLEQLGMTESEARSIEVARSMSEQLSITDVIAKAVTTTLTEQLSIQDDTARTIAPTRSLSEELTLTDTMTKAVAKTVDEQLGMTDIIVRFIEVSRSPSEQLGMTDLIAKSTSKSLAEDLEVKDEIQRMAVIARTVSDELTVTDTIAKAASRALTEQFAIEDTLTRPATLARTLTESLFVQDTIAKAISIAATEQLSLTDQIARTGEQSRSMSEQLTITDAIAVSLEKRISESFNMSDNVSVSVIQTRLSTEELALQDMITVTIAKELSEQLGVTDTLARTTAVSREMTEQMTMTDPIAAVSFRTMTEQLQMTDSIMRSIAATRTPSDELIMTDAISKSISKTLTEQMNMTESSVRAATSSVSLSEEMAMQDTTSKAVAMTMVEELGIQDLLPRSADIAEAVSEQVTLTDTISISASKTMSEQLLMQDTVARSVVAAKSLSEPLAVTETITKSLSKSLSEQMTVVEAPSLTMVQSRSVTEQMTINDTIAKAASRALTENLEATDIIRRTVAVARTMTEELEMSDAISKALSMALTEQLTLTEEMAKSNVVARSISEQLSVTDAVSKAVATLLTEQLYIQDTMAKAIVTTRSLSEDLALTDSIAISLSKSLSEQLEVEDTIARSIALSRSISEELTVNDDMVKDVSKSMSESLSMTDPLTVSAVLSASVPEQLTIVDSITASITKSTSEQMDMTESLLRLVVLSRPISEQIAVVDTVLAQVSKATSEEMFVQDTVDRSAVISRSIAEQLVLSETFSQDVAQSASLDEEVELTDNLSRFVAQSRTVSEQLAVTEAADSSASLSRPLSEEFALIDLPFSTFSAGGTASDQLAVQDMITAIVNGSSSPSESLSMTESPIISIAVTRSISEHMTMQDSIMVAIGSGGSLSDQLSPSESVDTHQELVRSISEQFTIMDSLTEGRAFQIAISEQLSSTEATTTSMPSGLIEGLATSDAITTTSTFARAITENMTVTESASRTASIIILELLQTSDQFTDISIHYHLVLGETLVLPDSFATDHASYVNSFIGHTVIIEDSVLLTLKSTNNPTEQLIVQDQLSAMHTNSRVLTETMQLHDSRIIVVTRPPPSPPSAIATMPVVTMTEKETVKEYPSMTSPMVAVQVQGTYPLERLDNATLGSLLTTIGMPVYDVSTEASSTGIDNMTMILPTFKVPIEMDGSPLNGGAFLTPVLSNLPANTQVVIPIDVTGSLGAGTIETNRMVLSFTPKVNSSNFALLISILDNNPEEEITREEPEGLSAYYIDVSYVGTWPGGISPSDPAFYFEPPQAKFTVTEEWAEENHAKRDLNNVTKINLFLLNEVTGTWIEISDDKITPPTSAVGNVYQYTVTLPHLSTYVVTAETSSSESGNGGPGTSIGTRGGSRSGHIVRLAELLSVSGSIGPVKSESLFSDLTGSFKINKVELKPLDQRVIKVDDISVTVHVSSIRSSAILGTAVARLNFEIENKGEIGQELMLRYWYSDPTTKMRIYENKETVMVGAGQSIVKIFEVPFTSPGDYSLMIEVESKEGTVSTTDIAINVPWLTVYLYILVIIAVIVIGASMGFVIFAIRSRRFNTAEDDR